MVSFFYTIDRVYNSLARLIVFKGINFEFISNAFSKNIGGLNLPGSYL